MRSRFYTGSFDLPVHEPAGTWAVVVVSQTLDDYPTGGDPIRAAQLLGGTGIHQVGQWPSGYAITSNGGAFDVIA